MVVAKEIKKEKNTSPSKKNTAKNIAVYRMLIVAVAAVAAIFTLCSIRSDSATEYNFVFNVLPAMTGVCAVLLVAAVVYAVSAKKIFPAGTASHAVTPMMLVGTAAAALAVVLFYKQLSGTKLIIGLIVVALLYFVKYLYGGSFYLFSAYTALSAVVIELISVNSSAVVELIFRVLAIAAGAFVLVLALMAKTGKSNKLTTLLMKKEADAYPYMATSAVLVLAGVLAFVISSVAFYATLALLICYLVIAIIYTIKMM